MILHHTINIPHSMVTSKYCVLCFAHTKPFPERINNNTKNTKNENTENTENTEE